MGSLPEFFDAALVEAVQIDTFWLTISAEPRMAAGARMLTEESVYFRARYETQAYRKNCKRASKRNDRLQTQHKDITVLTASTRMNHILQIRPQID